MKRKFKAVLFDMDGVLVDSMPYHYISWFEALRKYSVRVTSDDIYGMEGAKWDDVIKFVFKRDKKKLAAGTTDKIKHERNILLKKYFKRYIFDGIKEALEELKRKGFLTALVTGSRMTEAEKMLPPGIYNIFDAKVAGDMVKRSKPYPDSYLLAAKEIGVKPSECLVVENAPYGIKAAKAAGMYCAAIETSLPKKFLKEADIVFKTHNDLYRYMKVK